MQEKTADITPLVNLTGEKGTGPVRTRRPVHVDLLPPCNNVCLAGEHIQGWLALAQEARTAARRQLEDALSLVLPPHRANWRRLYPLDWAPF